MARAEQPAAFLGRDAELEVFARAVADAALGAPSVLLVDGDAGIGKTTLLQATADRSETPLLLGRSVHLGGGGIPLAPLVDLVRRVRRAAPDAPGLDTLTQLLAGTGVAAATTPNAVFESTLDVVAALGADRPVLVGFEDLHWADELTWDLVAFLARNLVDEQVVLVGTFRDHDMSGAHLRVRLAELTRLPTVHRLHLAGLDRASVARLVSVLTGETVSPDVVDDIVARGQGNPLFTEELVAARAAGEQVPSLLADLFAAELDQLDDDARAVLAAVAAVGRDTRHDLLVRVVGSDDQQTEAALRRVIAASLLEVDTAGASYRFRHPLIAEVVVESMLPPQRRRLHQRIADSLAEDPALAHSATGQAGERAFHLERAGDLKGACLASLEAADALAPVAQAAARDHLERALLLWGHSGCDDHDELTRRRWQAAELAYTTGAGARAVELAQTALADATAPQGQAWAHERLARYLWTAGRLGESSREYERAVELLDPTAPSLDTAAVYAGLAQAELLFCRFDSAEQWSRAALELVPLPSAQPAIWLHATRILGIVCSHRGHHDEAVERCTAAVAAADVSDDHSLATVYLAEALLRAARYQEAVTVALDGAAAGQRAGFDRSMGGYLSAMAVEALTHLGRWTEAATVLDRLAGLDAVPVTTVRLHLAHAALAARRGDIETAKALIADATALPTDPWHQAPIQAAQADLALLKGDASTAATLADSGLRSDCAQDVRWPARFALQYVVATVEQVLDARARREPVDEVMLADTLRARVEAARTACTPEPPATLPRDAAAHLAHAEAALTALTAPDPDAWARAADAWQQVGDPWATALAQLREAEAAISTGEASRATDRLRDAHAVATALGAEPLRADIDAVARRSRIRVDVPVASLVEASEPVRLGLTSREAEVLSLVAEGKTNRQIGEALFVSEKTASVHVSNILRKLGVTSRVEAAAVAQRAGVA